jgi:hypothetical protein
MKNIYVLPTDKPSRLYKSLNSGLYYHKETVIDMDIRGKNQNIYITNLEEIKDADWFITEKNTICKCVKVDEKYAYSIEAGSRSKNNCKKIILTTDQDLIKDGVQAIDDEFLEWFVKNPSCESVEVSKIYLSNKGEWKEVLLPSEWEGDTKIKFKIMTIFGAPQEVYDENEDFKKSCEKIIIPKEEPKQETLGEEQSDILEAGQILVNEETLEYGLLQHIKTCLQCNNESQAIRLLEKYGFEKQEERYSEEEVELITNEMVNWAIDNIGNPNPQSGKKFDEVIAKFKTNKI